MWVRKTETQQEGIYLASFGSDEISVFCISSKLQEVWRNKEIEILVDRSTDDNDLSLLLRELVLRKGDKAFDLSELLNTSNVAMRFYIEDSAFASENLAAIQDSVVAHELIRKRINTIQELLYFALGDKHDVGEVRDRTLMFIHSTLPLLMEGFFMGFVTKQVALCDCHEEKAEVAESEEEFEPAPAKRKRSRWCSIFSC
jgi:hypothetical protein